MCDVESYVYLPLLEEMGYIPKHKYSFAPEIFEYSKAIARRFDLYDDALFQTGVTELRWDDDERPLDHQHRPRRSDDGPVRGHGERPAEPPEAARASPASTSSRATRSTPAAGTTTTRAATRPAASTRLADKRVGIIGTGATADPVHPPPRRAAQAALRVPAHAVVGRRPQQPRDRPGVGRHRSSPAGSSGGWTTSTSSSAAATRTRTSSPTAGPTSSATSPASPPSRRAASSAAGSHRWRRPS